MKRFLITLVLLGLLTPVSPALALPGGWDDRAQIEKNLVEFNAAMLPDTDSGVRWDSLILEGYVITYHLTVLVDLDEEQLFYIKSGPYKQTLIGMGCLLGPEPFAAGYTFRIVLVDKAGGPLLDFVIPKLDCL